MPEDKEIITEAMAAVWCELDEEAPKTKPELAAATGLSEEAVAATLHDLIELKFIPEASDAFTRYNITDILDILRALYFESTENILQLVRTDLCRCTTCLALWLEDGEYIKRTQASLISIADVVKFLGLCAEYRDVGELQ